MKLQRSVVAVALLVVGILGIAVRLGVPAQAQVSVALPPVVGGFEYLRVVPYDVSDLTAGYGRRFAGYRACVAGTADWTCRDFQPPLNDSSNPALRLMLATLGNEGWEVVTAVPISEGALAGAMTYLFKRARH